MAWPQQTLILAVQSLAGSKVWIALILILLMIWIWIIVGTTYKRKNETISTSKSKYAFGRQELKRDFDLERRLRSGKRWQPAPDRFRRAATVC